MPNETVSFKVIGLDCAIEANLLQEVLSKEAGVVEIDSNVIQGKLTVVYNQKQIDSATLVKVVHSTGMKAVPWKEAMEGDERGFWAKHASLISTLLSGAFLIAAMFLQYVVYSGHFSPFGVDAAEITPLPLSAKVLYALSIGFSIWRVLPKAWFALKRFRLDIYFLMVVAIVGALIINEWFEGATVALLFAIAIYLEGWSAGRARKAIAALMELTPTLARVLVEGEGYEEKEVEEVPIKALIEVRPGEKIPLDAVVIRGHSSVDQSPITGESIPVAKEPGNEVFAGTINEEGVLVCEVTKKANETILAKIILLVDEARKKRSTSEQFVERFAKYYTPAMILLALFVMVVPPWAFGSGWADWFYRGLVLLVIACPCALVISTPVSIVSGLAAAAKNGILIKGGLFLERVAALKALAVDKTGTLTHGHPEVQKIVPVNAHTEEQLLETGAALEQHSTHPLAKAVMQAAKQRGITYEKCESFVSHKGRGIEATYKNKQFWLGSHRFMHEKGQETPEVHDRATALEDAGHSVVAIGTTDHVCGLISVADTPKEHIKETLLAIQEAGIDTVAMLTGDNKQTAEALAKEIGIQKVFAELLPEDKVEAVRTLQREVGPCGMVGDGVNDAPALAVSDVGIAMGAMGSDAAIETADVTLMTDNLASIPWLVRHAKKTLNIIRQNIYFALGVKALFICFALLNLVTLWLAIAADTGATLLVVLNSLRLLRR